MEIIRTKTKATGGITVEEKAKMDAIVQKWTKIAFRTEPINKEKITDAIYRLYEAANLKKPRVVIVPSPFVGRLASGIAASVWYLRKNGNATRAATYAATRAATYAATRAATYAATRAAADDATYAATYAAADDATYAATYAAADDATYAATDDTTRAATYAATYAATRAATYAATRAATYAATDDTTRAAISKYWLKNLIKVFTPNEVKFTLGCISLSWKFYQGGNMWAYFCAYAETMRDVIGLTGLNCWEKYQAWEDAAKEGGFRYMHEEFCIVSDFPEILKVNERNQPHNEGGPSHRWRDGFEIYYLNGVRFSKDLWQKVVSKKMPFEEILAIKDIDQRTQAMRYGDVNKFFKHTKSKLLDKSEKGNELWLVPKNAGIFTTDAYFLKYSCPSTGRIYMSGIEPKIGKNKNADYAMSWKHNFTLDQYLNLTAQS